MEFNKEIVTSIQQLKNELNDNYKKLKVESDEALMRDRLFFKIMDYLTKRWSMHFLNLVDREADRLKDMRMNNPSELNYLEEAYRIAKEDAGKVLKRYPSLLDETCKAFRIDLDTNSPHPKYGIKNGFFRLEIIESKRIAKLTDPEGKLAELPADIEAVVEVIRKEFDRVFDRKFDRAKFLKQLRSNYKKVIKKRLDIDGSSIPIKEITKVLRMKDKGFRMDEFIADLSNLAEKGPFEIDGRIIDLQQTKDTNQGILLIGAAARGYIGFIVFKEKL